VTIALVELTKLLLPGNRHWNLAVVPETTVTAHITRPPSDIVPV